MAEHVCEIRIVPNEDGELVNGYKAWRWFIYGNRATVQEGSADTIAEALKGVEDTLRERDPAEVTAHDPGLATFDELMAEFGLTEADLEDKAPVPQAVHDRAGDILEKLPCCPGVIGGETGVMPDGEPIVEVSAPASWWESLLDGPKIKPPTKEEIRSFVDGYFAQRYGVTPDTEQQAPPNDPDDFEVTLIPEGYVLVPRDVAENALKLCDMHINLVRIACKVDVTTLVTDTKTALANALTKKEG